MVKKFYFRYADDTVTMTHGVDHPQSLLRKKNSCCKQDGLRVKFPSLIGNTASAMKKLQGTTQCYPRPLQVFTACFLHDPEV